MGEIPVPAERLLRILRRLGEMSSDGATRLCNVSVAVTGMSGAGIMLIANDASQGSVCTSTSA
jgi:hypothetical protein